MHNPNHNRIRIRSTADAVAVAAALATTTIAAAGHKHHTTENVGRIMNSNQELQRIRAVYQRYITNGLDPREAIIRTGQTIAAAYCDRARIPTGK